MARVKEYLPLVVRVILGGVFIYAGVLKIADPVAFAGNVAAYKLVPYFWSYLTAAILPWVEVISGALLVCGFRPKAGAVVIALLNAVFIVALASAIVRGLDIDCGCFRQGGGEKTSPWIALGRDVVFICMALYIVRTSGEERRGVKRA
ncbi:DoxX family membrane protein [Geomonas sp. RF6]|nr:MauE/DoxX family redox-associated membrane protein [Geomonas sp. RF6]UFS72778.1 DoxX family membrane protein [Geomonas sp. RF6]